MFLFYFVHPNINVLYLFYQVPTIGTKHMCFSNRIPQSPETTHYTTTNTYTILPPRYKLDPFPPSPPFPPLPFPLVPLFSKLFIFFLYKPLLGPSIMTQTDVAKGRSSSLISSFVNILVNCAFKKTTQKQYS